MKATLPLGPAALAWAIDALRLRRSLPKTSALAPKTIERFLAGDRQKDSTVEAVVAAIIGTLFPPDLVGSFGIEDPKQFEAALVDGLHTYFKAWTWAAGLLNSAPAPVERKEHRLLPWVRLVVIDLAIRYGAYLRARDLPPPSDELVAAACEGNAFAFVLEACRAKHNLTHEGLANKTNASKNQPGEWLSGKSLPQSESILDIAPLFVGEIGAVNADQAELHLRVAVAASELVRTLRGAVGEELATNYALAFFSLADFVHLFLGQSKHPPSTLAPSLWKLVAQGARSPPARFILHSASANTLNQFFIEDLMAASGDWTGRLEHWARTLSRPDVAASKLSSETGMDSVEAAKLIDAAALAMLSLPTLGVRDGLQIRRITGDDSFKAGNHETLYGLAWSRGDFAEAEIHLRRMIELKPRNAKYHFWLATCLSRLGRPDEAIVECHVAAQFNSAWSLPVIEVGIIQLDHGRAELALATLEEAAGRFPVDAHLGYALGIALLRIGRLQEAANRLEAVLRLEAEHAFAMDLLAHCLLMLGDERDRGLKLAKEAAHRGQSETLKAHKAGRYAKGE